MNHDLGRLFREVYGRLCFKVGREGELCSLSSDINEFLQLPLPPSLPLLGPAFDPLCVTRRLDARKPHR